MKSRRTELPLVRQSVEPQWFDSDPSDSDLATFIDPLECSGPVYMRVSETPGTIRGDPMKWWIGMPILCELPVLGVLVWLDIHGRLPFEPAALKYPFIFLAFISGPALICSINRKIAAIPPFFVLDKASGKLELPRYGVTIAKGAVQRFVEVRGWKHTRPAVSSKDNSGITAWTRELTVLVKADDGRIARYAIGIDRAPLLVWRPMSRKLAEFFDVPVTEIKQ